MQLFTRTVSLAGPLTQVVEQAADMRAFASEKAGREIALWAVTFGAPVGTYVYTARVEGLADLTTINQALLGDPTYHAKLEALRALSTAPALDSLASVLHGSLGDPPPVGAVSVVVQSEITPGAYVDAVIWGVDMAQHVERITGRPALMALSEFGPLGQLTWIASADDAATADAGSKAVATDADYISRLNSVGSLFITGRSHRSLYTRIA